MKPGMSIQDVILPAPQAGITPDLDKLHNRIESLARYIIGLPDYMRGRVGVTEVATEVALADKSSRTRNEKDQERIFDFVQWAAEATINLYDQFLTKDSSIPYQLTDSEDFVELTRTSLDLRGAARGATDPWNYNFSVAVSTGATNTRTVRLELLTKAWGQLLQLMQAGTVDPAELTRVFLSLLDLESLLKEAPPADAMGQAQPPDGAASPEGAANTMADGMNEMMGGAAADLEMPNNTEGAIPSLQMAGGPGRG